MKPTRRIVTIDDQNGKSVAIADGPTPDIRTEESKLHTPQSLYSAWGPVFRVDVVQLGSDTSNYLLVHDGTFGSGIRRFNGDPASIAGYYDKDPRSIPFAARAPGSSENGP